MSRIIRHTWEYDVSLPASRRSAFSVLPFQHPACSVLPSSASRHLTVRSWRWHSRRYDSTGETCVNTRCRRRLDQMSQEPTRYLDFSAVQWQTTMLGDWWITRLFVHLVYASPPAAHSLHGLSNHLTRLTDDERGISQSARNTRNTRKVQCVL